MLEYSVSDAELPTMVVRCDNRLILRSIVTGQHLKDLGSAPVVAHSPLERNLKLTYTEENYNKSLEALVSLFPFDDLLKTQIPTLKPPNVLPRPKGPVTIMELPPCKVQRNYCCSFCNYCTQNPRSHLVHQRDVHGIRLSIHSCQHCQYASRYFQKLKRHIKMVHTGGNSRASAGSIIKDEKEKLTTEIQANLKESNVENNERSSEASVVPSKKEVSKPKVTYDLKGSKTLEGLKPAALKNPEAFFEAAYRNQLRQQQEEEQRLKELEKACKLKMLANSKVSTVQHSSWPSSKSKVSNKENVSASNTAITSIENSGTSSNKPQDRKRTFGCRKCSYVTNIKSRYNKHVKYHSMPMIKCDKCEFRTTYKWNLTRHLRSHHGNGNYKCSACSFSAHMKQSLTSHELNHHSPPVGHANTKKPIKRRRCRVGGSDLLHGKTESPRVMDMNINLDSNLNSESKLNLNLTDKEKVAMPIQKMETDDEKHNTTDSSNSSEITDSDMSDIEPEDYVTKMETSDINNIAPNPMSISPYPLKFTSTSSDSSEYSSQTNSPSPFKIEPAEHLKLNKKEQCELSEQIKSSSMETLDDSDGSASTVSADETTNNVSHVAYESSSSSCESEVSRSSNSSSDESDSCGVENKMNIPALG